MPFLTQLQKNKETLNSTHQYDDHTYNCMVRKMNDAKWREEEKENSSVGIAQKMCIMQCGHLHVTSTFAMYSTVILCRYWYRPVR